MGPNELDPDEEMRVIEDLEVMDKALEEADRKRQKRKFLKNKGYLLAMQVHARITRKHKKPHMNRRISNVR